jgi:hypothetical protein
VLVFDIASQLKVLEFLLPFGLRCWRLGTEGNLEVQSSCWDSCFGSNLSLDEVLFFDRRDSAPTLFESDLGAPTCLTEAAGMAEEPLLGGCGGLDDECRRWCACELKLAAAEGVVGREGTGEVHEQVLRATRRREVLNIGSFNRNSKKGKRQERGSVVRRRVACGMR